MWGRGLLCCSGCCKATKRYGLQLKMWSERAGDGEDYSGGGHLCAPFDSAIVNNQLIVPLYMHEPACFVRKIRFCARVENP